MTLHQLLAAHPKAVEAIQDGFQLLNGQLAKFDDRDATDKIRLYAALRKIGNPYLDSIASLLSAIEAKLAADAPLSDEEIEGMKWRARANSSIIVEHETIEDGYFCAGSEENRDDAVSAQHACIDRLAREIRRLRAKCGEVAQ